MKQEESKTWKFQANTTEEAIGKALRELGCGREEIEVKVVSEEKKGLFGMSGANPAKIVVKKKEKKS